MKDIPWWGWLLIVVFVVLPLLGMLIGSGLSAYAISRTGQVPR